MKQLAIKGHPTRGNEVIQILEMLGGSNPHNYSAGCDSLYFYIDKGTNIIYYDWVNSCYEDEDTIIFTLEEFLEKYPYKVGDMVIFHGARAQIVSMKWEEETNDVVYTVVLDGERWETFINYLQPFKGKKMTPRSYEEVNKYLLENSVRNAQNLLDIERCLEGDGLKLPDNININSGGIGSIEFIRWYENPPYPKSYEECCKVLGSDPSKIIVLSNRKDITHEENKHCFEMYNLYQLLICRDAYWKIAGEQMGLDKPWKPDYTNPDIDLYVIINIYNRLEKAKYGYGFQQCILTFPTEEMRDEFFENFKDLIERCKELL